MVSARERALLSFLAVALVTAAAFSSSLSHDFVTWDDNLHVYENPWLSPVSGAHLAHFWRHSYSDLYIPVSYMLFSALAWIAALSRPDASVTDTGALFDPRLFHAADLAIHIASSLIVLAILRRLVRNDFASAAGALLFAIHPLQVESVAWVAESRGVLAGFFCVAAAWIYVSRARETGLLGAGAWTGMIALSLLAVLSKPSAAMLPVLLFALAAGLRLRPARLALIDLAPLLAVCAPIVWLTRDVQHPAWFCVVPLAERPVIALDALAFYLGKLVLPVDLIPDYSRTPDVVLRHWWGYATWLLPMCALNGAIAVRRRAPYLLAALAIFAAALLPVLGLVPFGYQAFSTVADRYAYLALLGPAVAAAFALESISSRPVRIAAGLVLVCLFALTMLQTAHWANSRTLYAYSISVNPGTQPIQYNAGELLLRSDPAAAEPYFRAAIRANPLLPNAHINLGHVLDATGRPQEALREYIAASRLDPRDPSIAYDIGNTLMDMRRPADALVAYGDAIRLKPSHTGALNNAGDADLALGRYDDAAAMFRRAAQVRPGEPGFHLNAGLALMKAGKTAEAAGELQTALTLDPENQTARAALERARRSAAR